MTILGIVLAVIGVIVLALILRNYRKQREFEGTGRTPPEHYT